MDINTAVPSAEPVDNDVKLLHKMGYAQELSRRMGAFSNFAVSFSLICILSGGITSFQMGLSAAGGASIGLGWPLGSLFALIVAAAMAQIASSYPTAGGLYHWSSILGGQEQARQKCHGDSLLGPRAAIDTGEVGEGIEP